jgi:hypothetical protein
VREIEQSILTHPDFHRYCLREVPDVPNAAYAADAAGRCRRPVSVLNWYYPTPTANGYVFDGRGDEQVALESITAYLYKKGSARDLFDRAFQPPSLTTTGLQVPSLSYATPL